MEHKPLVAVLCHNAFKKRGLWHSRNSEAAAAG